MNSKQRTLRSITEALDAGKITKKDLRTIIDTHPLKDEGSLYKKPTSGLSATDIMFYIAGVVIFASIAALIGQSWDGGVALRVFLSAGLGLLFWVLAGYLIELKKSSDVRRGITSALLLTGSLSVITGGFIIANEFVRSSELSYYVAAFTFIILGLVHIVFGRQIKRSLLSLMGILLTVAAFPTVLLGLLNDAAAPFYIHCLAMAAGGGLLAYATRIAAKTGVSAAGSARSFDPLSAFTILMSLYVASYDDGTGLAWLLVMIGGIIGLFYLSIIMQDKLMLGNGSLFLVIAVITISFRYFSGYGIATSLFIGALGLIGTATVAVTINRRYLSA